MIFGTSGSFKNHEKKLKEAPNTDKPINLLTLCASGRLFQQL